MDFPIQSCIVAEEDISLPLAMVLQYHHSLTWVLLDLNRFGEVLRRLGDEKILPHYLSQQEQVFYGSLTSAKRKKEWLGGKLKTLRKQIHKHRNLNACIINSHLKDILLVVSRQPFLQEEAI